MKSKKNLMNLDELDSCFYPPYQAGGDQLNFLLLGLILFHYSSKKPFFILQSCLILQVSLMATCEPVKKTKGNLEWRTNDTTIS